MMHALSGQGDCVEAGAFGAERSHPAWSAHSLKLLVLDAVRIAGSGFVRVGVPKLHHWPKSAPQKLPLFSHTVD